MTKNELLAAYRTWLGDPRAHLPQPVPIANCDIFEDAVSVVNHLFFLIPDVSSRNLRCFFFLEANTFSKDDSGDLELVKSSFHLLER